MVGRNRRSMATMVEGFPVILPNASLTSCRPLLSLLQEEDAKLKFFALKQLEALVDSNWAPSSS